MDNNTLENACAVENEQQIQPAEEQVQPIEQPVQPAEEQAQPAELPVQPVEEQAQPAEQQDALKQAFADVLSSSKEAGKELTGTVIEKSKELTGTVVEKSKKITGTVVAKAKKIPAKLWIILGAGIATLAIIIAILLMAGNTYKTPLQTAEKLLNMKSVEKIVDKAPSLLNGFGTSEAKSILKIIKKSDTYKDTMEDAEDYFDDAIDTLKDEYGNNYKIKIKVEDKEKLDRDDVREFRDQLRDIGEYRDDLKDLESDDFEDIADELGISKSKVKDMVKEAEDFCKRCKSAKVSKGYELSIVVSIDGSEADDPEELDLNICVYKVDGRWVLDVLSLVENSYDLVYDLF